MTAVAKPDLAKRLSCPKLYAAVTRAVSFMVPEQHVEDVVQKTYVEALKKPHEAPDDDAMLPAWLKAFARRIAPRHMSKLKREPLMKDEPPEVRALDRSEDEERIARVRAIDAPSDTVAQVAEDTEALLRGESIAEVAKRRGEKPNTARRRAWRHAPTLAALLSSGLIVVVLFLAIVQMIARPGPAPDEGPGPSTLPPPAMSTPLPPPAPSVTVDAAAAAAARDAGLAACGKKQWALCRDQLERAIVIDASLATDLQVSTALEQAETQIGDKAPRGR